MLQALSVEVLAFPLSAVFACQVLCGHEARQREGYTGMTRWQRLAWTAAGYRHLASCQRFLQDTLNRDFGHGHRIFPVSFSDWLEQFAYSQSGPRPVTR